MTRRIHEEILACYAHPEYAQVLAGRPSIIRKVAGKDPGMLRAETGIGWIEKGIRHHVGRRWASYSVALPMLDDIERRGWDCESVQRGNNWIVPVETSPAELAEFLLRWSPPSRSPFDNQIDFSQLT